MNGLAKSLLKAVSERYPFAGKENTYLLVTGDVTDHGRNGEYDLAGQALTPFKDRIFITPGNHDYGSWGGTDYNEEKAKHFDVPFASALGFKHPFFDKKVFVRELQDESGHTLMMIGLNSCAKVGVEDWAQGEIGERSEERTGRYTGEIRCKNSEDSFSPSHCQQGRRFPFHHDVERLEGTHGGGKGQS